MNSDTDMQCCVAFIQSREQNDEESEHLSDFHPDFFYFHLSLMKQTPNKGGDSGDAVGEELDALVHAVSLWLVVPAAIPCALMISADDTVLNIGASSSRNMW